MSHPNRLRLSIADLSFAIWAATIAIVRARPLLNEDGDLARHIRMGEYILRHGVRFTDVFSFTRYGSPFMAYEWGAEVLYSLVHSVAGLAGVVVFSALLLALAYALLVRWLLGKGVDPLLAFLTVTAAAVLGASHWLARPHLFTVLASVLLLRAVEKPIRKRWLFLLFALWANLHPGFIFGLAVLAAALAGEALEALFAPEQRREWSAVGARAKQLVVAGAGTLLTPFGPALHAHILGHLDNTFILSVTSEFQSPDFHELPAKIFGLLALGVFGALALRQEKPRLPRLLVLMLTTWAALDSQRNIELFGVVGLPMAALELDRSWKSLRFSALRHVRKVFSEGEAAARHHGRLAATVAALLAGIALLGGSLGGIQVIPNRFDPGIFPVKAVATARAAGLKGNLFTKFTWGGYVLYAWPEQRIYIDGMTDFFGEDLVREYVKIADRADGWRDVLAQRKVGIAVLPPQSALAHALEREPGWTRWYADSVAAVLVRHEDRVAVTGGRIGDGSRDH